MLDTCMLSDKYFSSFCLYYHSPKLPALNTGSNNVVHDQSAPKTGQSVLFVIPLGTVLISMHTIFLWI